MEEGFATLFVKNFADADEFAGVVPFVVPQEDVQGVEFEDFDAGVEVARCVGSVGLVWAAGAWGVWAFLGVLEAVCDVELWSGGGG